METLLLLDNATVVVFKDRDMQYCVGYKGAAIQKDNVLCSIVGRGKTLEDACNNYIFQINGKKLVFNAESKNRREVNIVFAGHDCLNDNSPLYPKT